MKRSSAPTERPLRNALAVSSLIFVGANVLIAPASRAAVVCVGDLCPGIERQCVDELCVDVTTPGHGDGDRGNDGEGNRAFGTQDSPFVDTHYGTEDTPHLDAPEPADDQDGADGGNGAEDSDGAGEGDGAEGSDGAGAGNGADEGNGAEDSDGAATDDGHGDGEGSAGDDTHSDADGADGGREAEDNGSDGAG